MSQTLHLVKLSVGTETIESQAAWQELPQAQTADGLPRHITRMWPRQSEGLLNGGSIYWVIKGFIQSRQRIVRLNEVIGGDGIRRCAIVLDPELIRVAASKKRPFQGWRYLQAIDAPIDLGPLNATEQDLPPELSNALAEIGVF